LLCHLTDKELYYLQNNRSLDLYETDMEFLVAVMGDVLRRYESEEEYEICHQIFTSVEYYRTFIKI
jgi:hypothetical protein